MSAKRKARLVVPVVLAVSTAALAVIATTTTAGCGEDTMPRADAEMPRLDAALADAPPDTPIV